VQALAVAVAAVQLLETVLPAAVVEAESAYLGKAPLVRVVLLVLLALMAEAVLAAQMAL